MNIIKEIFTTISSRPALYGRGQSVQHILRCAKHKRFHQRAQFLFTGKNIVGEYLKHCITFFNSCDKASSERIPRFLTKT